MLLRGENRRMAELADLFTHRFADEGPQPCFPLIMMTENGKVNQYGKKLSMAAIRHKEPMVCPLGHLAMYLFWLWEVEGEERPQLHRRELWYGIKLLRGDSRTTKNEVDDSSDKRRRPSTYERNAQLLDIQGLRGLQSQRTEEDTRRVLQRGNPRRYSRHGQQPDPPSWAVEHGCYVRDIPE